MEDVPTMSGSRLVFVDIETTSLDPVTGEVWEVGAIARDLTAEGPNTYIETEYHAFLRVDHLETADLVALDIGGYHERHPEGDRGDIIGPGPDGVRVTAPYSFAKDFEKLTRDATLVGANVRFDERFLNDYLRKHHRVPSWFFRLCDVEALAQGYCGLVLPTGLAKCANILEIPNEYVAHEALSDALLARDVYDAVVNDRFGRRKS